VVTRATQRTIHLYQYLRASLSRFQVTSTLHFDVLRACDRGSACSAAHDTSSRVLKGFAFPFPSNLTAPLRRSKTDISLVTSFATKATFRQDATLPRCSFSDVSPPRPLKRVQRSIRYVVDVMPLFCSKVRLSIVYFAWGDCLSV
jgi:hypothetical protein